MREVIVNANNPAKAKGRARDALRRKLRGGGRQATALAKASYQRLRFHEGGARTIGLVMGAQRSGTGMLVQAFDNDWSCKTFGEDGGLALGPGAPQGTRWRWKPCAEVAGILRRQHAPLLIAKPLVESQRAEELLQCLPGARIIWAYRHYRDVAASGQAHFGAAVIRHNLASILERRCHWYAENVDEEIRDLVARHFSPGRSENDLRALGWYVRNSHVFRYRHLPVTLSSYEDLVAAPAREMRELYAFLGHEYPGDHVIRHINSRSVGRGRNLRISEDIRALCDAMLEALGSYAPAHAAAPPTAERPPRAAAAPTRRARYRSSMTHS